MRYLNKQPTRGDYTCHAAFDRTGGRLGYGQGHFDRAVAALAEKHPVLTVGLAFSVQEIDRVPTEDHDVPLDFVVTEAEVVATRRGGPR